MSKYTPTRRQLLISGVGISLAGCLDSSDQSEDEEEPENDTQSDEDEEDGPEMLSEEELPETEEIVKPEEGELTDQFLSLYESMYDRSNSVIRTLTSVHELYDGRQFERANQQLSQAKKELTDTMSIYNQERNQKIIEYHRESTPKVRYQLDNLELMFTQLQEAVDYFETAEESRSDYETYKRNLENAQGAISYAESLQPMSPTQL